MKSTQPKASNYGLIKREQSLHHPELSLGLGHGGRMYELFMCHLGTIVSDSDCIYQATFPQSCKLLCRQITHWFHFHCENTFDHQLA